MLKGGVAAGLGLGLFQAELLALELAVQEGEAAEEPQQKEQHRNPAHRGQGQEEEAFQG